MDHCPFCRNQIPFKGAICSNCGANRNLAPRVGRRGYRSTGRMPALPSNAKTAASARKAARRNEADRDFMWGLIWLLGGIALTAASHSFASQDGGSFWIFIGAMAYGAGRIIRGACTLWLMR